MFFISNIKTVAQAVFKTPLQEKVYQVLQTLQIPFQRVETDEAISMEDCLQINEKLQMKMVKPFFFAIDNKANFICLS